MDKICGEEGCISLGPWGGEGGKYWAYKPDGPILQITIHYHDVIESILFKSNSRDGVVIGSSRNFDGPFYDSLSATFCIDSSVEQFSSVSVTYKNYYGRVVVSSLCFNTNLNKYGPFGSEEGHCVFIPTEGEVITGFHGRGERYLDAIGIFVAPKVKKMEEELKTKVEELKTTNKELKDREDVFQTKMKEVEAQNKELKERVKVIEVTQKMKEELKTKIEEQKTKIKELKEREDVFQTKMEEAEAQNKELRERIKMLEVTQGNIGCISSGIGGGEEGAYWAYKFDGPIMLISFQYGNAIDSVIFQSKIGDKVGRSVKIGGIGGHTRIKFSIDSSVEQISSISLTYEQFHGEVRIVSLSFETNVGKKYGPVGSRMGTSSVSIPIEGGDFAGFHGRVGTYLTAIGVLVAPKQP